MIAVLFSKCNFCDLNFCTFHGLPEEHGCDDRATNEERMKNFRESDDLKYEQPVKNLDALKMKAKK